MLIVVDANIVIKLFAKEGDSEDAHAFFRHAILRDWSLLAPSLLRYEVWEGARRNGYPMTEAMALLEAQERYNLHIVDPTRTHVLEAVEIVHNGHAKSGFPSFYDSIYHAMAITEKARFLTADRKHYLKTRQLGHILDRWRGLLEQER